LGLSENEVQNFMVNIIIFIHFPYFFHAKNGGQRPVDIQPLGDLTHRFQPATEEDSGGFHHAVCWDITERSPDVW